MCALGSRSGRSLLTLLALLLSTLSGARAPLTGPVEHGHEARSVIKPAEERTAPAEVAVAVGEPARSRVGWAQPAPVLRPDVVVAVVHDQRRGSAGGPRAP
jgi:hypothetical protein